MCARLSLLLSLVVLGASAQLQVIVQPPDPTGWYEACIREAYACAAQTVAMPASAVWYVQLLPASSFAFPGVLASTTYDLLGYEGQWPAHTMVNTAHDYYFGLDGDCPGDEYDLVSVLLHELLHSMGFHGHLQADGAIPIGPRSEFDVLTTDARCRPVGAVPSPYRPYYFDCKFELADDECHLAGDALMAPVRDAGTSQHLITCADAYVLERLGWNITGACSSASDLFARPVVFLSALAFAVSLVY